jgi:putative pyruvate formate lyase activating enzyme
MRLFKMMGYEPGYLKLFQSGELEARVGSLWLRLKSCDICPRRCGVDRLTGEKGFCRSGSLPIVSSYCAHHGEEPPISGSNGSGTIFFGNCNMRCQYCQNFQISQDPDVQLEHEVSTEILASIMIHLQNELKCHNINLVTPTHFVPQILQALVQAIPQGLKIPLVYNTGGYDSPETIRLLDGIIDIYLPDLRYADDKSAEEYSLAPDYVRNARSSIKEMYRQQGILKINEGIAYKGVIVRHLILPEDIADSAESLEWIIKEVSQDTFVSIMAQYYPVHKATEHTKLSRRINIEEYNRVINLLSKLQINNGWVQELESADNYIPDFSVKGHPFERNR